MEVGSTYNVPIVVFSANVLTDPSILALTLRDPASNLATYTYAALQITRTAAGLYSFPFSPTLIGRHVYTVTSATPNLVSSGEFTVIGSGVFA